jgi:hypothetical protein
MDSYEIKLLTQLAESVLRINSDPHVFRHLATCLVGRVVSQSRLTPLLISTHLEFETLDVRC